MEVALQHYPGTYFWKRVGRRSEAFTFFPELIKEAGAGPMIMVENRSDSTEVLQTIDYVTRGEIRRGAEAAKAE